MAIWRLLLSEYPESILKDSFSLAILALLERKGMLTEDEVALALKEEKSRVISTLLALQKNRMVEFSRQSLKVTERGKLLLDRFGLADEIVSDVLRPFAAAESLKRELKASVLRYRSVSFSSYLNSLSAVESWRATCGFALRDPESATWIRSLAGITEAGCLSILLSDLKSIEETHEERSCKPESGPSPSPVRQSLGQVRRIGFSQSDLFICTSNDEAISGREPLA